MKKIILLAIVFLTVASTYAQQGINYKAIVSDNGAVLQSQAVDVQFSILEDGTTLIYQETHSTTTDANGIVILNIGEGIVVSGVFNNIDWSNSQFLKVEIDLGSGYVDFGTTAFKTVPYAKYAENGGANWLNELGDVKSNDFTSLYVGLNSGVSENDSFLDNTALGTFSLRYNTGGNHNTAIGSSVLTNNQGSKNTAIGSYSLISNISGERNLALGYLAGRNSVGNGNIFLGNEAGSNETGSDKLYIENSNSATPLIGGDFSTDEVTINGSLAIVDGTEGVDKVLTSDANGKASWQTASTGGATELNDLSDAKYDGSSVFIGNSSGLNDDATTNYNTGVGHFSLHSNTSGSANTSVGNDALYKNTTGSYNSAFGFRALYENTTGSYNTAYGYQVLYHNTTGEQNTASGRNALFQNTTGSNNTAYGWSVLSNNTTGYNNTAIGNYVLPRNTTGHSNIALGSYAGFYNVSGSGNIFLGRDAGYNETGSNKLYIENSNSATPLIGGDFSTNQVTINGTLDVSGNLTANLIGDVTGNVEGKITATHSGNSDMKAYIYGSLYATGSLKTGPSSDGFTSIKIATGHYRITFDTSLASQEAYLLIATASNTTVPQIITCHQSSAYCDIYIWDMSSNPVDAVFNFVVYKK